LPVRTIDVKHGDVVVFHDLLVHSSFPNSSGEDRWSLISTYRDAGVEDKTTRRDDAWDRPLLLAGRSVNGGSVY
jgi:ectoine hydroxylase-related dioxygenase (phytanoyl-CoA dioxygenase family)